MAISIFQWVAGVVELVYTQVSKTCSARNVGSIPTARTIGNEFVITETKEKNRKFKLAKIGGVLVTKFQKVKSWRPVMQKIELTVHEFMAIMGALDEERGEAGPVGNTIYDQWFSQWKALDERLEKLDIMERADMLFDGKVAVNAISAVHFEQLLAAIRKQVSLHQELIEQKDEDADPDDLKIWENRLEELTALQSSVDWQN
tara:strand:+ start:362 stop:967 length:606 start_codon:yes stop_codon:yes gene_type:complete